MLKKDPDIDQSTLTNGEKTVIIDVLKNRYSLLLLQKLQLSKMIIIIKNKKNKLQIKFYTSKSNILFDPENNLIQFLLNDKIKNVLYLI